MKTVAGWNMPGYLPEMEPETFPNAAEAVGFLMEEVDNIADQHGQDNKLVCECDDLMAELEQITDEEGSVYLEGGNSIPSGLVFWWNMAEDEDEDEGEDNPPPEEMGL